VSATPPPTVPRPGCGACAAATSISVREAGIWAVIIVAASFWANVMRGNDATDLPGLGFMMNRVLDNGAFDVLAWSQIFARVRGLHDRAAASWVRCVGIAALGVIALAPVWLATGIDLLILGTWLRRDRHATQEGRQAGLIMLVCALEVLWRSRLLSQLPIVVANFDARICALLLSGWHVPAVAHANFVTTAGTDFTIAILPYCASSMPLAGICLAFVTVSLHLGRAPRPRDAGWLGLSIAASIALTEVRLTLMAIGEESYHWWHEGTGVTVYALAAVFLAVLFPALARRDLWSAGATRGDRAVS
jgi:exosortase/archaeosortase family protein